MDILFFDRRPMFLFGLLIIAGIYLATGESTLNVIIFILLLIVGAFIGGTNKKYILMAVIICAVFFGYSLLIENIYDKSYTEYDGVKCSIRGVIISVNAVKEEYAQVTVRPNGFFKKKIQVYIMNNKYNLIQGDKINFIGSFNKPTGATNPGGYDTRKVLYSDGIAAYVFTESEDIEINSQFTLGHIFGLIRKDIKSTCTELLGGTRGSILSGMLIGDKAGLGKDIKTSFRDSGLSHTMAVSGAHVAYILVPLMFIFSRLGLERRKYYPWLLFILLFFALLTGFTPSVARASLTAGLLLISGIIYKDTDALNSLAVSAVILVMINPFSIYDAGFILSYICVVSILVFYKPLISLCGKNPVVKMMAMTIAVQIGVLPATAKLFYSIQMFSVISNLLIFPIRAVLAVLGWIMYIISNFLMPLAKIIAPIVGILTDAVTQVAKLFGDSTFSSVNVPYIPVWLVVVYITAVYLALNISKYRLIPITLGIFTITTYLLFFGVPKNTYVFYDSGQADSFLVKTDKARDIIIDTGKYSLSNSIAHFCGDYIDFVFLTHAHQDHIGGLESILERFRVGMVFIPGCRGSEMSEVIELCKKFQVPCKGLVAGVQINVDDYEIIVLNPFNRDYLALNDTSLVLKLNHGDKSLLFCGDIEIPAEMDVLKSGANIEAEIFKVPHHGAGGSAYSGFYDTVSSKIAIISCGENYFGHPSTESLQLLSTVSVYRTDQDGAIIIKEKKDGYKIKLCKKQTTTELKLN